MGAVERARTPGRGFTMVELMVVIAIIGILVALLVGAVGPAIAMATNIQCQSNLTNIAKAVLSYTTDYKGSIPPTKYAGQSGLYWCNFLVRGNYLTADNTSNAQDDTPSSTASVLRCPAEIGVMVKESDDIDLPADFSGSDKAQGVTRLGSSQFKVDCSYYWNGYAGNTTGQPEQGANSLTARFPSCVVDPAATPDKKAQVVHDISEVRSRSTSPMVMDGVLFAKDITTNRGRIAARHRGDAGDHTQTNIAFYDGHVEGTQRMPGDDKKFRDDAIQSSTNFEKPGGYDFLLPKR